MSRDPQVRARILEAAIQEVDRLGPAGLRIQAVCEAAGVTDPIIYRHFGSREGLIEEVQIERYVIELRADAENFANAAEKCSTIKQFRSLVRRSINAAFVERADRRWVRLNVLGSAYARPELEARLLVEQDKNVDVIAGALRSAKERGLTSPDLDPDAVALWQHGVLFSRVFYERGPQSGLGARWNKLTMQAIERMVFGD